MSVVIAVQTPMTKSIMPSSGCMSIASVAHSTTKPAMDEAARIRNSAITAALMMFMSILRSCVELVDAFQFVQT